MRGRRYGSGYHNRTDIGPPWQLSFQDCLLRLVAQKQDCSFSEGPPDLDWTEISFDNSELVRGTQRYVVNRHITAIPACAALGLRIPTPSNSALAMQIDPDVQAVCDRSGRIDRGAALILADQATAGAVGLSLPKPVPMVTLDLRVDWVAELPDRALTCEISEVVREGLRAVVRGSLKGHTGLVGHVVTRFLMGAMPGGATSYKSDAKDLDRSQLPNFEAYLGAVDSPDGSLVRPLEHHIGGRALPAFHGGVVAALLEHEGMRLAPGKHPLDIEVRYLSPARADRPLCARATPIKLGRRASTIDVAAFQEGSDRPVAIARLLAIDEPAASVEAFRFAQADDARAGHG